MALRAITCVVLLLVLGAGISSTAAADSTPDSCGAIADAEQQKLCIISYVDKQKASPGLVGSTCSSLGPNYVKQCVVDWVIAQQQSLTGNAIGGCAGVAPDNQWGCAAQFVIGLQQNDDSSKAGGKSIGGWHNTVSNCDVLSSFRTLNKLCVIRYVDQQKKQAGNGAPGSDCSSRGPDNAEQCVIDWVIEQQQAALGPNGVGGCAGVAPDQQWACAVAYVSEQQKKQEQQPGTDDPRPGATCASIAPGPDQQACINRWVDHMMAQQSGNRLGGTCASRGPDVYQDCVIAWVIQQQQAANPGLVGGCAGTNPADGSQLACVNAWVLAQQANGEMCACCGPANGWTHSKTQACFNSWLMKQKQKVKEMGCGVKGRAKGAKGSRQQQAVARCIQDYVSKQQRKQGISPDCKSAAKPNECVNAWIAQQMQQMQKAANGGGN